MDDTARIRDLITRHAGTGITTTVVPGLYVMLAESPTVPLGHLSKPSLAFVAGGAKMTLLADKVMRYGAGEYLVVGAELPVTAHISEASAKEPFLGFGLDLDPGAVAALLLEAGEARAGEQRSRIGAAAQLTPVGMAVSEIDAPLLNALARLVSLLDEPAHVPGLAPAYEREILWRILAGPQGELVRQVGLPDSRLTRISRSLRFIRDHYRQPIKIDQLAQLSAMSSASFHRHFHAVTNMTPIQFQKQLRLQAARALLMADPGDVAGAGFAVGYESASQFSREYRREYGESPGRDAQMLRDTASTAVVTI